MEAMEEDMGDMEENMARVAGTKTIETTRLTFSMPSILLHALHGSGMLSRR
jgi:hypothetical protein